jgi:hypothetical protein
VIGHLLSLPVKVPHPRAGRLNCDQQPKRTVKIQTNGILPFTLVLAGLVLNPPVRQPAQAQSFTFDAPLLAARWLHMATVLTN